MTITKQQTEALFSALEFSGFIGEPEFDGDIHQPNHMIRNDLGVYIGDVLEAKGFEKTEKVSGKEGNLKTWTMFTLDGFEICHRSFSEIPDVTSWDISYKTIELFDL